MLRMFAFQNWFVTAYSNAVRICSSVRWSMRSIRSMWTHHWDLSSSVAGTLAPGNPSRQEWIRVLTQSISKESGENRVAAPAATPSALYSTFISFPLLYFSLLYFSFLKAFHYLSAANTHSSAANPFLS